MATKKSSKRSAAKKGSKRTAAKKTTKSAAKAQGAVKRISQGKCGGWRAWHDKMPPGPFTLHVQGRCTFPTTGYKVRLVKAVPQGINPAILLLRKIVTPPTGITLPVVQTIPVAFKLKTNANYTHVTILPDVVTVKVRVVV
jgi:hypothetical protein